MKKSWVVDESAIRYKMSILLRYTYPKPTKVDCSGSHCYSKRIMFLFVQGQITPAAISLFSGSIQLLLLYKFSWKSNIYYFLWIRSDVFWLKLLIFNKVPQRLLTFSQYRNMNRDTAELRLSYFHRITAWKK